MSKFSEKLKYLIEDSGNNIYQLAKNAGLDRTTIQRSITGERLPGIAFVETLCDYLRVSPTERKDLMEFYSISKIGEKTYAGRKYVKELLEQIAVLHIRSNSNLDSRKSMSVSGDIEQESKVFSGKYSVNNIIRDVLEDEVFNEKAPHICLAAPFEYTYLFDCLRQLYWGSSGKVVLEHIVRLSKNPHRDQNPNVNLEMLSHVLPFAFCIGNGYQPHYYYAAEDITKDISLAMPYYLCTSKRLITLSADFNTAVLYNDSDIKDAYYEGFQKSLSHTTPFIRQLADCSDMVSIHLKALSDSGQVTNVIEPQPCFAKYYTHKMIDEHLRPEVPDRDTIKQALYKFYDGYNDIAPGVKSFFSIEGLKYFIATGIMADLPPRFALPFTLDERKYLIKSLRDDIKTDNIIARVTDPSKFLISSLASIQLYKSKGIMFLAADNNSIVSCYIGEQSICDAFYDFFESLPESELVFSKEETIKVLDELIKQLENLGDGDESDI